MSPREYSILPLIINILVYVIIQHWVGIMVENADGPDGFGYTVADNMKLFNAYYGLIDSTNPVWLHRESDILIGLFERFGIRTYMEKMVTMVCRPEPIARQQSVAAYGWLMTGEVYPKHMKQRHKLVWGECGAELDVAYMTSQLQMNYRWQGKSRPLPQPLPILTQN